MTEEEENAIGHEIMRDWNNLMEKINTASTVFSKEGNLKLAIAMNDIVERAKVACLAYGLMATGDPEFQESMKKQVEKSYRSGMKPN
jgi:hypothetical protein